MKKQSLIKTTLGQYNMQITSSCSQSHVVFRVEVPRNTKELVIEYAFSPEVEKAKERIDVLFRQYKEVNEMDEKDREYIDSIRNLVTVSARSDRGFEGSCHRFMSTGKVTINETASTKGMRSRQIVSGFWEISLNFHALVTEQTTIDCTITAKHEEEKTPVLPIQFNHLEKKPMKRNPLTNIHTYKVELHTHTDHSDAFQTSEELIEEAIKQKIDWLAITDHNTLSVFDDEKIEQRNIQLLKGLEMTTFFGHFLTIGYEEQDPVDWTMIDRYNLDTQLKKMKDQGLLIGIAHPFDVGSPYCTGCRWQYVLENVEFMDFVEVWNGDNPASSLSNADAFEKWTQLLNAEVEIPATCGRDWHHTKTDQAIASLYVLADKDAKQKDILEAIQLGRSYITLSSKFQLKINDQWTFGDKIAVKENNRLDVRFQLDDSGAEKTVLLRSNIGSLLETKDNSFSYTIDKAIQQELHWLRVEVYDGSNALHAFSNPIYFSKFASERG